MKKNFILFLLSVIVLISLSSCGEAATESGEVSDQKEISTAIPSEDAIGNESAYLSVELFQFSTKINGVVYKLPAMQTAFTTNGWSITEKSTETVKASFKADGVLSKEETSFDIQVINPTKEELPFEKCPIGRISYDFSGAAEIYIADSFLLNEATKTSITEKYGEPETTENHSDFSEITYGSRKTAGNYAKYLFRFDKSGKIIYFSVVNHYMPD